MKGISIFECSPPDPEETPYLCCPDCREATGLAPRLGPANQIYHCASCTSDWRLDGKLAPTPHSPLASVSNALAIFVGLVLWATGLALATLVGAAIILTNHLAPNDLRLFTVIGMTLLLWLAVNYILFSIYNITADLINRGYRYVTGEVV